MTPAQYKVLLIEVGSQPSQDYSDVLANVGDFKIDVISPPENLSEWIGKFSYNLVVIDSDDERGSEYSLGLLETIRRISPITSVILVAGHASVDHAVSAIRLGAEDYLKKPFNHEGFQLAVKRGLDRRMLYAESSGVSAYLNLVTSCQMISASLESNRIFQIIQSYIRRELKSNYSGIFKIEKGRPMRVPDSIQADRAMDELLEIALHAAAPFASMEKSGEIYRIIERGQLTPGLFIFRFRCLGAEDYFCVCLSPEMPQGVSDFEGRLRLLRAQIEVTGKNIEQYQGVQNLAYVDDATGLYNTRYLYNILEREIANSKVSRKSFAILFMDGDRFKSINDTHGHLAGTKLLHELGAQLKKFVRGRDTVFRYGGDEFVAVLPGCGIVMAQQVAERIRKSVEEETFLRSESLSLKITVSIGVALYPDHADSVKAVINAADHAMYTAKKGTRNSVFVAPIPQITTDVEAATLPSSVATSVPSTGTTQAPHSGKGKARA